MHNPQPFILSRPRFYRTSWFALIVLFLLAGLIGHEPWKQDETYSFGIIYHFLQAHTWLVPVNAGVPFMEKPPLYYWSAVLFCKLLGGLLPLPDAARLTSLFYMLVTVRFLWLTSQVLFARRADRDPLGWITLVLLLGSMGLIRHAHDLFTDVALLSGVAITMYGLARLACTPDKSPRAGLWMGLGYGIAFLSKGLFVPGLLGIASAVLLVALPELRTKTTIKTFLIAGATAAPFLILWPALLYQHSPPLFMEWFWDNNIGRFLGFSVGKLGAKSDSFYFLRNTPWFAFPAVWLAGVEVLAKFRTGWRSPEWLLPVAVAIVGLAILGASASGRALYLLPLMPAFALLGAPALVRLSTTALIRWNVCVRMIFTFATVALWSVWFGLHGHGRGPFEPLVRYTSKWLPADFQPAGSETLAIVLALLLTAFWIASFRFDMRSPLHTARIWFAGVAVAWGLVMTLLLPWLDAIRGYRIPLAEMLVAARAAAAQDSCISSYHLGESLAPMFEYASGQSPVEQNPKSIAPCGLLFTRTTDNAPANIGPNWQLIWKGARPMDTTESLRLYQLTVPTLPGSLQDGGCGSPRPEISRRTLVWKTSAKLVARRDFTNPP